MSLVDPLFCNEVKRPFILLKWKVKAGSQLFLKTIVLTYTYEKEADATEFRTQEYKLKSTVEGTVMLLLAKEGDVIQPGAPLLELQSCTHEVIMKDLCAQCGTDLRQLASENLEEVFASRSFSMVHVVPELKVSKEQAEQLDLADEARLLKCKRLVLLVDLDQTLIHTTNEEIPANLLDVFHFQLYGPHSHWYHTRLRPGTRNFLQNISKFYELHIFTFGARLYAHKIAQILDPDGKLFSHRILSRDECFDATSKTGNLRAMFPRGDSMVCIIDDREDVWNFAPNVVHVKPYTYFHNTGDINALPYTDQQVEGSNVLSSTPENMTSPPSRRDDCKSNFDNVSKDKKDPTLVEIENIDNKLVYLKKNVRKETDELLVTVKGNLVENNIDALIVSKPGDVNTSENCTPIEQEGCITSIVEQNEKSVSLISVMKDSNVGIISKENNSKFLDSKEKSFKSTEVQNLENSKSVNSSLYATGNYDDDDDYLLYLEEILITIHKAYYDIYDQMVGQKMTDIPDLKTVIPYVRVKVLKDVNVVFSGVIPTNMPVEKSRLWTLAKSLGANVSTDLVLQDGKNVTTHVVAAKLGTAKLREAKKIKNIHIVTPNWLLCCATRWERADERLFPLTREVHVLQIPKSTRQNSSFIKMECTLTPESNIRHQVYNENMAVYDNVTGKRIRANKYRSAVDRMGQEKSEKKVSHFATDGEKQLPLSAFALSSEDLADMDREVDEACTTEESDGDGCEGGDEVLESNSCVHTSKRKLNRSSKTKFFQSEHLPEGEPPFSKRKHTSTRCNLESNINHPSTLQRFDNGEQGEDEVPEFSCDSESSGSDSICSEDEKMAAAVERELLNC